MNCKFKILLASIKKEKAWFFLENRNIWKPGPPEMKDSNLVIEICKAKGWGIKGILEIKQ